MRTFTSSVAMIISLSHKGRMGLLDPYLEYLSKNDLDLPALGLWPGLVQQAEICGWLIVIRP